MPCAEQRRCGEWLEPTPRGKGFCEVCDPDNSKGGFDYPGMNNALRIEL